MDAAEEHRKEALRRKGQEFLEKAISQASTKSSTTTKSTLGDVKIVPNASSVDPALETVGVVVEGLKDYIAALVFVLSSAASLVLAKATLTYLNTPATAVFLHMLTAVAVLLAMSAMGEFTLGPYSWASLRQCSAEVICSGLQTLCLFGLLHRESVYLVAVWVTLAPQLLQVVTAAVATKRRPRALVMLLALIGTMLAGSALVVGLEAGAVVSTAFMVLWAAAEVGQGALARALGTGVPADASLLSSPPNKQTIAMYKNALAALPVLVVGLVFKEGVALMRLELSVPTLTCLLLSCVAWGLAGGTQMVMQANTQQGFQLLMASLSHIGIVVAQIAVFGVESVAMLLLASAGVTVAVATLWAQQL